MITPLTLSAILLQLNKLHVQFKAQIKLCVIVYLEKRKIYVLVNSCSLCKHLKQGVIAVSFKVQALQVPYVHAHHR